MKNVIKEQEKRQKQIRTEMERLMARYVQPHNIKSRHIRRVDIDRMIKDGKDLLTLCSIPRGAYPHAMALAHSQIDSKAPLRYFVLPSGFLVINPLIVAHTQVPVMDEEGCMSFPDMPRKALVPRYHKIEVEYQTLIVDPNTKKPILGPFVKIGLSGKEARVFQHEICHLNGCCIYDEDFSPEKAVGLGNGIIVTHSIWDNVSK